METPHWFRTNHGWGSSRFFQKAVRGSPRCFKDHQGDLQKSPSISQLTSLGILLEKEKTLKSLRYQVFLHLKHGFQQLATTMFFFDQKSLGRLELGIFFLQDLPAVGGYQAPVWDHLVGG